MRECLTNCARRHRLQPESLHWLLCLRVLHNQPEDQLTLAARVTGINDAADVFTLEQLVQQLQARFGFLDRVEREMRRDHRQVGERPFAPLDVVFFRRRYLDQVTDRR